MGIPGLLTGLRYGDWAAVAANLGILVPFGLGVIVGIFAIAKLIEVLLARWEGQDLLRYPGAGGGVPGGHPHVHKHEQPGWGTLLVSLVTFALGFYVAWRMSGTEEPAPKA